MAEQGRQGLSPAEVEDFVRKWFEIGNSLDPDRITELYTGGYGFGYRTKAARPPHPDRESYRQGLDHWLSTLDSYTIRIEEIHTSVEGGVGIAWGLYCEEFQETGKAPEVLHGRFSEVVTRDERGWRTVFYHRDMTPFDAQGRYVPDTKAKVR